MLYLNDRYIAHLWRRGKRKLMKRYRLYLYSKQQKHDEILLKDKLEQCQTNESGIKKLNSMYHYPIIYR